MNGTDTPEIDEQPIETRTRVPTEESDDSESNDAESIVYGTRIPPGSTSG